MRSLTADMWRTRRSRTERRRRSRAWRSDISLEWAEPGVGVREWREEGGRELSLVIIENVRDTGLDDTGDGMMNT